MSSTASNKQKGEDLSIDRRNPSASVSVFRRRRDPPDRCRSRELILLSHFHSARSLPVESQDHSLLAHRTSGSHVEIDYGRASHRSHHYSRQRQRIGPTVIRYWNLPDLRTESCQTTDQTTTTRYQQVRTGHVLRHHGSIELMRKCSCCSADDRSSVYSLQFNGEIVLYRAQNTPCVAEYKIRTKSQHSAITCMAIVNPMRTHLYGIHALPPLMKKSLEHQAIFFGHANGCISLFQGDSLLMEPVRAHQSAVVCLEASRASMEASNVSLTHCEVLLSASQDNLIDLWDLTIDETTDAIRLIHLLTVEQEKNVSVKSIRFLSMIDNFLVANYSDQHFLHLWQLLNITVRTDELRDQWGIVEHPTKGDHHRGSIQGKRRHFTALQRQDQLCYRSSSSLGYGDIETIRLVGYGRTHQDLGSYEQSLARHPTRHVTHRHGISL